MGYYEGYLNDCHKVCYAIFRVVRGTTIPRLPSVTLITRVPFCLVFLFVREPWNKKGKKVLLRSLDTATGIYWVPETVTKGRPIL